MDVTMFELSAVGMAALVGGAFVVRRRRAGPAVLRQRQVAAFHRLLTRDEALGEEGLSRRLSSLPALLGETTVTCDARRELLSLVAARRHQSALFRWLELRSVFRPQATAEALDDAESVFALLAERSAGEDLAAHSDARLVEHVRNHPYFRSFSRRSPPGVRRFFELLNSGRYDELLCVWPDLVAAWWEDEGGQDERRSAPHAPELRAIVRLLASRAGAHAA